MKGITTQEGRETLNKFKMEAANEVGVKPQAGLQRRSYSS